MNSQTLSAPGSPKQVYARPALQIYGNLAQITSSGGVSGKQDGGGSGNHNSH
jgi:hypothetical protein